MSKASEAAAARRVRECAKLLGYFAADPGVYDDPATAKLRSAVDAYLARLE